MTVDLELGKVAFGLIIKPLVAYRRHSRSDNMSRHQHESDVGTR